jgi:hypothetical protein
LGRISRAHQTFRELSGSGNESRQELCHLPLSNTCCSELSRNQARLVSGSVGPSALSRVTCRTGKSGAHSRVCGLSTREAQGTPRWAGGHGPSRYVRPCTRTKRPSSHLKRMRPTEGAYGASSHKFHFGGGRLAHHFCAGIATAPTQDPPPLFRGGTALRNIGR